MKSIEGRKLINKMQRDLLKNGIIKDTIVEDLRTLRPHAIKEEDPTLTKVIRLTYEHLEEFGTFQIPVPEDDLSEEEEDQEVVEGEEEEKKEVEESAEDEKTVKKATTEEDFEKRRESLDYLFSLMSDSWNKMNREELKEYRDSLLNFE